MDIIENKANKTKQLRFRIEDPKKFGAFATKVVKKNIHLIIGFPKGRKKKSGKPS